MSDRVSERRRAAALARHYREQEDLTIAEIARRLGRAEATVKAYLYDPSDANKRPTDKTSEFTGGYGGLAPPARRLVLVHCGHETCRGLAPARRGEARAVVPRFRAWQGGRRGQRVARVGNEAAAGTADHRRPSHESGRSGHRFCSWRVARATAIVGGVLLVGRTGIGAAGSWAAAWWNLRSGMHRVMLRWHPVRCSPWPSTWEFER